MTDLAAPPSTGSTTAPDPDEARVRELAERLVADHPPASTDPVTFLGAQFDAGLAWIHFDEGFGGLGLRPKLQRVVSEVLAGTGAPSPLARNPIGHGMGAPTVFAHGSEAQKQRYLRPLFTGEEVWCQMFSEPGAGSDVASLGTQRRARRRGVDRQRPEGLDHRRPPVALGHARGPHRPRPAQAQGPHLLRGRHAGPRRRGPAALPDHRRGRVQRGVLHRRPGARRRAAGRRRRRLARRHHHADERAGLDRRRHPAQGHRHHPDGREGLEGRRPARRCRPGPS